MWARLIFTKINDKLWPKLIQWKSNWTLKNYTHLDLHSSFTICLCSLILSFSSSLRVSKTSETRLEEIEDFTDGFVRVISEFANWVFHISGQPLPTLVPHTDTLTTVQHSYVASDSLLTYPMYLSSRRWYHCTVPILSVSFLAPVISNTSKAWTPENE